MVFELEALPYARDALTPFISRETLDYHYGKHHQAYVNKMNVLTEGKPEAKKTVEELVKTSDGVLFNQAAQVWNHTFYWKSMAPNAGGAPKGEIAKKIAADFGSFEEFKTRFAEVATAHFGSGWVWLILGADGKLKVEQTHDAQNPLRTGVGKPILTCDVWEHAYYIDYRNDRPKYLGCWWSVVNWDFANKNLTA
eukprot:Trichotokara_eunicae@DN2003_c0_g1_i1.p1